MVYDKNEKAGSQVENQRKKILSVSGDEKLPYNKKTLILTISNSMSLCPYII